LEFLAFATDIKADTMATRVTVLREFENWLRSEDTLANQSHIPQLELHLNTGSNSVSGTIMTQASIALTLFLAAVLVAANAKDIEQK
jgi:hypothetical protein